MVRISAAASEEDSIELPCASEERLLIVHCDDVGMCHSALRAFEELWSKGRVSSGSVMAPCAWFPAVREWAQDHPEADLGLHITMTSEWKDYRWGPVSRESKANCLLDSSRRYFYADNKSVLDFATIEAIRDEMESQLDFVMRSGIQITHLDNHMYTCLEPRFLPVFLHFAAEHKLPGLVTYDHLQRLGSTQQSHFFHALKNAGLPIFDRILIIKPCSDVQEYSCEYREILSKLPPGLYCLLVHPAKDSKELRRIIPDFHARVTEYRALSELSPLQFPREMGLRVINYRYFY